MVAGDILWSASLDGSDVSGATSIFLNDDCFVVTDNHALFRVDGDKDGEVIWQASAGSAESDVNAGGVLTEAGVYITGTVGGDFRGYDFDDGSVVFQTDAGGNPEDSAPALGSSDDAYIGGGGGGMKHFDINDGSILHENLTGQDSSPAIFGGETILQTTNDGLRGYDTDLTVLWETGSDLGSSAQHPGIGEDGYGYHPGNNYLFKISSSGNVIWQASMPSSGSSVNSGAAPDTADNRVYVSMNDRDGGTFYVAAYDTGGTKLWQVSDSSYPTGDASHTSPVVLKGGGCLSNWKNGIAAWDRDGNQRWFTELTSGAWVRGGAAASEAGFAVVGAGDGNLYAVEIENQPKFTLQDANARPWDYSRFRNNSGQFEASGKALVFEDGEVALRGGDANQGEQVVVYAPDLGRAEQDESTAQDVLMYRDDVGQG